MTPNRVRLFVERFMPWYDRAAAHERDTRIEALRQRSIALRISVEHLTDAEVRAAYRLASRRMVR